MTQLRDIPDRRRACVKFRLPVATRCARWAVLFLLLLLNSTPTQAAEFPAIESLHVGFNGQYRVGYWVPIQVEFTDGPDASIVGKLGISVADGDGVVSTVESEQTLAANSNRLKAYAKFGRVQGEVTVRFAANDGVAIERTFSNDDFNPALPTRQKLVVSLGGDVGVARALALRSRSTDEKVAHAVVDSPTTLPDHWIGYEGVNLLVIPTLSHQWIRELPKVKANAIVEYVRHGGQVMICAGAKAAEILTDDHPFSKLLPARFEQLTQTRSTSGIEEFVGGASQRLDMATDSAQSFRLTIAGVQDVDGRIFVSEGFGENRLPVILGGAIGLGQTIFVAFDLDSEELSKWADRPKLVNRIMGIALHPAKAEERQQSQSAAVRLGFNDLIGQMRLALFPTGSLIPFSVIAGLVGIYLLCIGPLDYLFLKHFTKRFSWTWFTFPLLVAAFCGIAFGVNRAWNSTETSLKRLSIVDVDLAERRAYGHSWFQFYTPNSRRFDFEVEPTVPQINDATHKQITWQGLPGQGFGGMNGGLSTSGGGDYQLQSTVNASGNSSISIHGMPILTSSGRGLFARWDADLADGSYAATSDLLPIMENQLDGTVTNPLTIPLKDCLLVYDRWAYPIPLLRPGQPTPLSRIRVKTLRTVLTRQEFIKGRYKAAPWDVESTDLSQVAQMMMFFSAVQGENYTNLVNRYQDFVDCSNQLKGNRAILVGRATKAPDRLVVNGEPLVNDKDDAHVIYRISIPLKSKR